ncbi:hypothetical protein BH10PSE9_BH10PSE9_20620 [soil metagenome]
MKGLRSSALFLTVSVGMAFAASPASAWICTAKNARGATYSGIGVVKANAIDRAMAKCRIGAVVNATCVIISCIP